jgi:hypothetical protein
MNIYVASSWRNDRQSAVVKMLRDAGHTVYDFRQPTEDDSGFHWSDIDPMWQEWSMEQFRQALPTALQAYHRDRKALDEADAVILIMPCGRSAHLELGYAVGRGTPSAILLSDGEPELMYSLADRLCTTFTEISEWLDEVEAERE